MRVTMGNLTIKLDNGKWVSRSWDNLAFYFLMLQMRQKTKVRWGVGAQYHQYQCFMVMSLTPPQYLLEICYTKLSRFILKESRPKLIEMPITCLSTAGDSPIFGECPMGVVKNFRGLDISRAFGNRGWNVDPSLTFFRAFCYIYLLNILQNGWIIVIFGSNHSQQESTLAPGFEVACSSF